MGDSHTLTMRVEFSHSEKKHLNSIFSQCTPKSGRNRSFYY